MRIAAGLAALSLLAFAALTGCGSSTPQAVVTATPATPTATATAPANPACHMIGEDPAIRFGAFLISITPVNIFGGSVLLSSDLLLKPLDATTTNIDTFPYPRVNPSLSAGFLLDVCNVSFTAPQQVDDARVKIDSFTPVSGTINSYDICAPKFQSGQLTEAGCGGGFDADEWLEATFGAHDGAGVIAPARLVQAGSGGHPYPPLPVTLQPGQSVIMNVAITPPTANGTYTFSFSVTSSGVKSDFIPFGHPIMLTWQVRKWSGTPCATPAMKAQIPANSPDAWICPE